MSRGKPEPDRPRHGKGRAPDAPQATGDTTVPASAGKRLWEALRKWVEGVVLPWP